MSTSYKFHALSRILILLAFCRLSTTQILYVGDFCDFAGYDGTCLEASKCADLQPIMQELGFESHQVGRCGFEVREEIICCPKRPTPVQTPPKLPNEFIDLSKHPAFGYTPPPESVFNPGSILITTNTPIILNQNSNGNRESVQSEDDRLNVLFNGNTGEVGTGSNVGEWNSNFFPVANGNNNGIFSANPLPNVNDNTKLNGNPVHDENELLKNIFGENPQIGNGNSKAERNENPVPIISGNNNGPNVIDNARLNGNPVDDENELLKNIFGENPQIGNGNSKAERLENPVPIISGNNNELNANPIPNINNNKTPIGSPVYDENERLRDIFGDNPVQLENNNSKDERKANPNPVANVNDNRKLNGNPVFEENEKFNAIFSGNTGQLGNENINGIFNASQASDENELLKAIFGDNPVEFEEDNSQVERKGALPFVPVANGNNNGFFNTNPLVIDNQKLNSNPAIDENERLRDIFGDNPQQLQNGNSKNERNGNAVPVANGNNNGAFNTNSLLIDIQKLNGNPAIDENERFNAIFGGNPGQPENENINGIFNASPGFNINNNKNLNGNPVNDANERLKDIFGDNPVEVGNSNSQGERKGNPVPVANENSNGFFNANPVANANDNRKLNGLPVYDENERFNAIFNGNPGQAGGVNNIGEWKGSSVPFGNENNNGFFNVNSVANANDNQKPNDNANYDENERLKDIFGENPPQLENDKNSGSNSGISNSNSLPKENVLGGKQITFEGKNIFDNAAMANKAIQDETAKINAILNGKLNRIGSLMMGANEYAGRNGQIGRNPIRNEHDGFNPNLNRNAIFEIQTNNDKAFPSRYDSPAAFGHENMNGLFNGKSLRAEHPNEGMQNVFLESGNSLNNGQHVRFEETLHHRRQQAQRRLDRNKTRLQSRRNQRIRFYK